ncbi:molybdopterin molybdotransferase MoeA [Undibacterium sp. CY18W]|uniref:Molybdopterin molybdenumtransferase n=1 Tax=Undibacterium hunanense TaxID=2762292 RepID=A0ABR6ZKH2_9BURK|nr:gephyrin-like molybdotransferase Glp [Undibacterium hunanense]MBC3916299.1 molybdopterin molybdotransferase MoeA [Undibacterium hunanense]
MSPANTIHSRLQDIFAAMPDYDPHAVTVEQAQEIIGQFIQPLHITEQLPLRQALGRVLAEDIVSAMNVPAHDNSAMDGFAFRGDDLPAGQNKQLRIVGTALAGRAYPGQTARDECIRITTGAVMPAGCDTVIPQELIIAGSDTHITIPHGKLRAGDNRRLKGEDLAMGKTVISKGRILKPADLGLLASLAIAEVSVQRRLRVAFFSTGDELRSLGEPLDEGCVYDSNRYTLFGMLTSLGCEVIDMGVVKDRADALETALCQACEVADAIITSGGVSVGAADYTRDIMAKLGQIAFWSVAMRPGRPLAFGQIAVNGKSAYLFGLPGNPVAVMVSFYFFARQALYRLMGATAPSLPLIPAIATETIRKRSGRTEFQRGILSNSKNGDLHVSVTGSQGSGILRSMSEANCIIVLQHDQDTVLSGEKVHVLLFDGLL